MYCFLIIINYVKIYLTVQNYLLLYYVKLDENDTTAEIFNEHFKRQKIIKTIIYFEITCKYWSYLTNTKNILDLYISIELKLSDASL